MTPSHTTSWRVVHDNLPKAIYNMGMDILKPFPFAKRKVKFLFVVINYFTKWIEVELLVTITT